MRIGSRLRSWARTIFLRSRTEDEMNAELRFHLQERAEALERNGIPHEEAFRRARVEFGGVENFKQECRDARGANFFESLLQDLRFGTRMLRKSPGFTAVAVLTLALGIGANTAIFSIVDAVLLRPLPYPESSQLVSVLESKLQQGIKLTGCSYMDYEEFRAASHVFAEIAGAQQHDLTLTGQGDPSEVDTVVVTPEMFSLLQTKSLAGRVFLPGDGRRGAVPVVILSEKFWRAHFGADTNVIGRSITLDHRPFTVVGIMPTGFRVPIFTQNQDIWIPLVQDPLFGSWMTLRGGHWLPLIARLQAGVSLAQAQAAMNTVALRLTREYPAEKGGWSIDVNPLQKILVGDTQQALFVLLGAVGLVLLLACANVANLLLSRATSRTNEMALRLALGAPRSRITRQLFTESALLGMLGAVGGVVLACWSINALATVLPPGLLRTEEVHVDGWVLGFALILSLFASLVFGLAPAFWIAGSDVQKTLKTGAARTGEGRTRNRARSVLATAEIGLALVLVVASGLLLRSLLLLTSVNPGFDVAHVVKAEVSLPRFQYATPKQWNDFSDEMLQRIQAQPGLQDAALVVPVPIADGFINLGFSLPGAPPLPPGTPSTADFVSISPGYFHVMRIPLLNGRIFDDLDSPNSPRVAIITEVLAHTYFANENPIGKQISISFPPESNVVRNIVGVVADVHDVSLHKEPGPMVYVPFSQQPFWGSPVVVRTTQSTAAVAAAIRQSVREIDPNLPVTDIAAMPDILAASVSEPRFRAWLLGLFGVLALFLATAGIFGVISYGVSCRTREFGVRLALGASPSTILRMILREGLIMAATGVCVGGVVVFLLARFLQSQLFGISAHDPLTFSCAAVILVAVAILASYIPARHATRVDPMVALRYE